MTGCKSVVRTRERLFFSNDEIKYGVGGWTARASIRRMYWCVAHEDENWCEETISTTNVTPTHTITSFHWPNELLPSTNLKGGIKTTNESITQSRKEGSNSNNFQKKNHRQHLALWFHLPPPSSSFSFFLAPLVFVNRWMVSVAAYLPLRRCLRP